MRVAYLGPEASYTHQATIKFFGHGASIELSPCTTINDAFAAVQNGETDYAVVPFENSSNGSVIFTLDLFVDQGGKHGDIIVTDEVYLPVSHCLLGRHTAANSLSGDLSHVTKLYSHPQAWTQCNKFLSTHFKGVERQDVSSTARAAQIAAEEAQGTSAAISSKLAAELNGLDVLAEGIEDNKSNTTRFLVLQRVQKPQAKYNRQASYKTMVSFTIDHVAPGSLADALAVFKAYDLNLTSINSRPSGQGNWMYEFFIEFRGHNDDESVKAALGELKGNTKTYRWLGSWKDALVEG